MTQAEALQGVEIGRLRPPAEVDQVKKAAIASFVASSNQLAILPPTALRIVELANDPKASMTKIAALVRTDPGLASRILATANSAMYLGRFSTTITSLEKAISRIGLEGLKAIVLQLSMVGRVLRIKGMEREVQSFSTHSVYAACSARSIARKLSGQDPETAFLVGLLHDVGKIIGLEALMKASAMVKSAFALEAQGYTELLDLTHEEIGGFAAQKWKLPPIVVESIRHHHFVPERIRAMQLPLLIHVANRVAHQLAPDDPRAATAGDVANSPELALLGFEPSALEPLVKTVPEDAQSLLRALQT
ncbi:HDOD domain-containing protein [Myxococcota bacterium]|nr:HDOD domain-containing protein [Myxococcota bacterium]